jgi:hypothetical protein
MEMAELRDNDLRGLGNKLYDKFIKGVDNAELVAAFDMDDTLISTKSGARFAKNAEDWQWLNSAVVNNLK